QIQFWRRRHVGLDPWLALRGPWPRTPDLRGRESGGRSAAPTGPELQGALGRGREGRGDFAGDLGDRANRRFMPADGRPRSIARRRQRPALRRLADGALRNQDAAGIRRNADDARVAALAARQQPAFARSPLIALAVTPPAAPDIFQTPDHGTM